MAKKHFIIEAKGSERVENNTIIIEKFTYIEKNHRFLDRNGEYKKIRKENISVSDWISIILSAISVILILVMLGCFAFLRDGAFSDSVYIDNIISEIGLVFAIISTKYVRTFFDRVLLGPRILKKLMICIFVMLAPFYIVALFASLGISQSMSNCISVVAILSNPGLITPPVRTTETALPI